MVNQVLPYSLISFKHCEFLRKYCFPGEKKKTLKLLLYQSLASFLNYTYTYHPSCIRIIQPSFRAE